MKIAVSYDNGNVGQHFGHAEAFKIYEMLNGEVANTEIIEVEEQGHGPVVALMQKNNIDLVITGWIGDHAIASMEELGIPVFIGAEGEADAAVEACLTGQLERATSDNAGGCGGDHAGGEEAAGCGGSCGSCGGCGGAPQIIIEGKNAGKVCHTHYRGTLNDGTQFDSSYDRGEPLTFICGVGQMIRGYDEAVVNMEVGQEIDIHLTPDQAYGEVDPNAIMEFVIAELPGSENLELGQQVYLRNQYGQPIAVKVTAKDDTNITLDANHEMAGKELNFHIELVAVDEA